MIVCYCVCSVGRRMESEARWNGDKGGEGRLGRGNCCYRGCGGVRRMLIG